jgi:hypothetical protein
MEGDEGSSRHSIDELIKALVQKRRLAQPADVAEIINRIATAPFSQQQVAVPRADQGQIYQNRVLGAREDSHFVHLVRRIRDRQWAEGTTAEQYLNDLRMAAQHPAAALVVYDTGRGAVAATLSPNGIPAKRLGDQNGGLLFVVYAADRSSIITGYQVSDRSTIAIPGDAQWLK